MVSDVDGDSTDEPVKRSVLARWEPIVVTIICVVAAAVIVVKLVSRDDGPSAEERERIVAAQEQTLYTACQDAVRAELNPAADLIFPELSKISGSVDPPLFTGLVEVRNDGEPRQVQWSCNGSTDDEGATYTVSVSVRDTAPSTTSATTQP
jgi:hypothetical protein